jgi:uncharacterized protein YlzI (FlbEa/FlbD family)
MVRFLELPAMSPRRVYVNPDHVESFEVVAWGTVVRMISGDSFLLHGDQSKALQDATSS